MNPDILLFDEPTVGQDYRSLTLIIEELNRINHKYPLTMITITNDTRCDHLLGDYALWMRDGQVYETGDICL